jgi:hypothetical protein
MLPLTPRREPATVRPDRSNVPDCRPPADPGAQRRRLLLLACAWFALLPNRSFVQAALKGRDWGDLSAWGFGAALVDRRAGPAPAGAGAAVHALDRQAAAGA